MTTAMAALDRLRKLALLGLASVCIGLITVSAGEPAKLKENDSIAMLGDSITYHRGYTVMVHTYLVACRPVPGLRVTQFGFGGAYTFEGTKLLSFAALHKPTVVTTCFGMNDVLHKHSEKSYTDVARTLVQAIQKTDGVRLIILGSPGCVDSDAIKAGPYKGQNPDTIDDIYQSALRLFRDTDRKVAAEEGIGFADVYTPMFDAMGKAKAKCGATYTISADGVHPKTNGTIPMAYSFLKALGCDGNIGSVTVDLSGEGKADAADGHKIISSKGGKIEIESNRYPFCFESDPKSPDATSGIAEYFPFNQELNRFLLTVTGAKSTKLRVTWGKVARDFDTATLEKGINLASEFPDNPFNEPFKKVMKAVRASQTFHEELHGNGVCRMAQRIDATTPPELAAHYQFIQAEALRREREMQDVAAAAVVPVRHTLMIEPLPEK